MKKITTVILVSIISSALTALIVLSFTPASKTPDSTDYSKLVNDHELVLSGALERYFKASEPNNFIEAANKSKDAVVALKVIQKSDKGYSKREQLLKSNGSGVIIDARGYVVTNYHVIEDAIEIEVLLEDKRAFKASLVGADEATDLAVLKISADNLPYLIFGNSDSLQVGEWVLAIGNPFQLHSTVTAGIVSAKARNINILEQQGVESFIQTDAAINSGNSGGALINTNGELVGINTAIMSTTGKYQGFSFAMPSNLVRKIIFDIREFGAVQRGWLGISILNMDAQRAKELSLGTIEGVYIDLADKDGAAKSAGIIGGDIILKIEGIPTNSTAEFMEQLAKYRPGDVIEIEYFRNGSITTTNATLRNQMNTTDFIAVRKDPVLRNIGVELRELDSAERMRLGIHGVLTVSILKNSIIEYTNMDPGFIITQANGIDVTSVDHLIEILEENKSEIELAGFYENYPDKYSYTFVNN